MSHSYRVEAQKILTPPGGEIMRRLPLEFPKIVYTGIKVAKIVSLFQKILIMINHIVAIGSKKSLASFKITIGSLQVQ
jgi:hypothetical protein